MHAVSTVCTCTVCPKGTLLLAYCTPYSTVQTRSCSYTRRVEFLMHFYWTKINRARIMFSAIDFPKILIQYVRLSLRRTRVARSLFLHICRSYFHVSACRLHLLAFYIQVEHSSIARHPNSVSIIPWISSKTIHF